MATSRDDPVAELFAVPPEEFTAARDRLARELKDAGDPAAADVAKLRRPTLGAWVVNQLARRERDDLNELLRVGERLRSAQRAVIEGGSRDALREAGGERRRMIDRLLDRAQEILREAGRPAARNRLEGVEGTLLAATMSEDAAAQVARGTLSRELEAPAGFEGMALGEVAAPPPSRPSRREERLRAEAEAADEDARRAEDEAARLEGEARAADRAARDARARADRATEEARRARARAEALARRAAEAGERSRPRR